MINDLCIRGVQELNQECAFSSFKMNFEYYFTDFGSDWRSSKITKLIQEIDMDERSVRKFTIYSEV